MEVKITYPARDRKKSRALLFRGFVKWLFSATAYVCPIINISAGGPAWSIYVLWALLFIWSFAFSRDLVEYNLISQTAKFLVFTCVLLALIDIIHSLGWAMFVIPIICFGGLAVIAVFFFSNINIQKQNIMPMMWLIIASIIGIVVAISGWKEMSWPMIVLISLSVAILIASTIVLGKGFIREIVKRFSTK